MEIMAWSPDILDDLAGRAIKDRQRGPLKSHLFEAREEISERSPCF
jgi:hypothetical protein